MLAMTKVLIRREGALGRLTLNRPEALNALSPAMIRALAAALDAWESDDEVAAVLLDGAGTRGLCAGGDVRFLYDDRGGHASAVLLAEEYRLDARIAHYPKPYVAVMDGLVMGGGVGISAHGSVRVVTERTQLAMPEVGIGNVPDVGSTHMLAHAPGELGTHAALTGAWLTGGDAIARGLADVLVPAERLLMVSGRGDAEQDEGPARAQHRGGLLADGGHPGTVEGEVEAPPTHGRSHLLGEVRRGRVECDGAELHRSLSAAGQRVDLDDRRGAGEAGDPDVVRAHPAHAPDTDGLGRADAGG
jgi:enoyl-CoA hydratase/carnithine racemase